MRIAFYKGTRPGFAGNYNRIVRCWTSSPYSHCELIFSDGWAASSSYTDGGVRFKRIEFDPARWDIFELPAHMEAAARAWFVQHQGEEYDLIGNVHFIAAPIIGRKDAWFCSESIAAALQLPDPWRYDPGTLASAITFIQQPASAGFLLKGAHGT
jgi:hypothetical protein